MTKVLMDDSSLNAIANSIRRKNGLVRTYKPREMAPAIRAFAYNIPSAHDYTVTINQSDHQRITVRKYLDQNLKEYTQSFTVAEPNYKLDISIEADAGWQVGTLNYQSPVTVDRDIIIQATPATEKQGESVRTVYVNGVVHNYDPWTPYSDPECTQPLSPAFTGTVNVIDRSNPDQLNKSRMYGGSANVNGWEAQEIRQNVDVSKATNLYRAFYNCPNLKYLDVSGWDTSNCDNFVDMFARCHKLRELDVTGFSFVEARTIQSMFASCEFLESLILPTTECPYLTEIYNLFSDCTRLISVDLSGLDTSVVSSSGNEFYNCNRLKYIIIDYNGVRKNHDFSRIPSSCKILVPQILISDYQTAYPSQANKFDDIAKYTITRSGGQVWVSPNPY